MDQLHRGARRLASFVIIAGLPTIAIGGGDGAASPAAQSNSGPSSLAESCPAAPATAEPFVPALADSGKIYRGTFGPAGDEFWFFKKVSSDPDAEDYRIFVSRHGAGGWSPAARVDLGGEYSDLYPTLSRDGGRLVFTSYRRAPGDTASKPSAGLWSAERTATGWSDPVFLAAATRIGAYHSHPTLGRDGRLFFHRTSPDWDTTTTMVAAPDGNGFAAPVPYEPVERWRGWRADRFVWGGMPSPDTSFILLEVSPRVAGERGQRPSDLWVTFREPTGWSEPAPLGGGVNTDRGWENFAAVTPDGCSLIFVRDFSGFFRVSLQVALPAHQTP